MQLARIKDGRPRSGSQFKADVPPDRVKDPANKYVINKLEAVALRMAQSDYHANSRTHLFYCLAVGKLGVRGAGATPKQALREYEQRLREVLISASSPDLVYWLEKCEAHISENAVRKGISSVRNSAKIGLSGQIGMRLPAPQYEAIFKLSKEAGLSWNAFVAAQLAKAAEEFDLRAENTDRSLLLDDIEQQLDGFYDGDDGGGELKSWAQRLPRPSQAKLLALAHEFGYSLSRFATYLLFKSVGIESKRR